MFAIGLMTGENDDGKELVSLFNGTWFYRVLFNDKDIPNNHPDFGLFQYESKDPFCSWVDASKLSLHDLGKTMKNMKNIRLCISCRYYFDNRCYHPKVVNPVTAKPDTWRANPTMTRNINILDSLVHKTCSKNGRLFEPKNNKCIHCL